MTAAKFTREACATGGNKWDIAAASVVAFPVKPRSSTVADAAGRGPLALMCAAIREGLYRIDDAVREARKEGTPVARDLETGYIKIG